MKIWGLSDTEISLSMNAFLRILDLEKTLSEEDIHTEEL